MCKGAVSVCRVCDSVSVIIIKEDMHLIARAARGSIFKGIGFTGNDSHIVVTVTEAIGSIMVIRISLGVGTIIVYGYCTCIYIIGHCTLQGSTDNT